MNVLNELLVDYKKTNVLTSQIKSSKQAYELFNQLWQGIDFKESVNVLYLDNNSDLLCFYRLSTGGLTGSIIDVREVLSIALRIKSTAFIIAHNHPSGRLDPSTADVQITQKLKQCASILDLNLLDHLIVTSQSFYSFSDSGKL